jgi:hypothetical protein
MKHVARLFIASLCAGLTACSDPPPAPEVPVPAPQAAATERSTPQPEQITRETQGVLTDAQAAGLNAANQVSNTLEAAEKERQRKLEEATR